MNPSPTIAPAPLLRFEEIGMRCLVTGGAGYLGRALVKRLVQAGCKVRSFDVLPHTHEGDVEIIVGDLRSPKLLAQACADVDTVFHTAALISILSIYRQPLREQVFAVNVQGTQNLLQAAASAGVKAFVHTSSFNVALHPNPAQTPQDESAPYASGNKDLYSMSKIAAEQAVLQANQAQGMRTCALRPGGIWGSDVQAIMIKSFLTQLAAGKFTVLIGRKTALMDNTHVENLVDAQLLAARALRQQPASAAAQAYNISDGESMNAMEWFRPLAEGLGYPFPTKWLPLPLMRGVGRMMELAHYVGAPAPLLTIRGICNLSDNSCLSIQKAQQQLGYAPRYTRANGMPLLLPAARRFVESLKK